MSSMAQNRPSDDNPSGTDYDDLYCEQQRDRGRYELVCDSIKCALAEQLTAHGRRVCAARYKAAVDRLLTEVDDDVNRDTLGGAA